MVTLENYEEYMMLDADGELTPAEQQALFAFVAMHPHLQPEYESFRSLKLQPDMAQVYEQKDKLLKKEPVQRTLSPWWVYGMAACVAALIGMWLWRSQPSPVTDAGHIDIVAGQVPGNAPVVNKSSTRPSSINPVAEKEPLAQEQAVVATVAKKNVSVVIPAENIPAENISARHTPASDIAPMQIASVQPMPVHHSLPLQAELYAMPLAGIEQVIDTPEDSPLKALLNPDDNAGLYALKDVVSEKIDKARYIKSRLKNTDVSVRVGNKELFNLRF